jgi:hypothetical protein
MQGYIHHSRKIVGAGDITCCSGRCTQTFWSFSFDDCDPALAEKLREKDVTGIPKDRCSPRPPGCIRVRFESEIRGDGLVAVNIVEQ